MSARKVRSAARSAAAAVAASALLGSAALAFPGVAAAATPAKPPLQLSVTPTAPGTALNPGGAVRTEIVTVTNTTGTSQPFTTELAGITQGAVNLRSGELTASVTALGRTPTTISSFKAQTPGYVGLFVPKGSKTGVFTVPAHATFTWKVSVAATKAWPLNDGGLRFIVGVNEGSRYPVQDKQVDFILAQRADGPMVESLRGDASLSPSRPAYATVTLTNRTGADLRQTWSILPDLGRPQGAELALDVWVGSAAQGHWQSTGGRDLVVNGLRASASATFKLRVRVVAYTAKTPVVFTQLTLINWDGVVTPSDPFLGLTVRRA
ncbi:hypothetical protein [Streptacidiphilus anmyonensis]|uniref:hypothetical protein n=1 Tax=Streptacidiphilus anmyonensis TaxID=405782 RepID=UPI0005A78C9F|nr:hypothetical protein [Streptacidiphilus anmyonensis]